MEIFDCIYVFNLNRRVYDESKRGGPIWIKHWEERRIESETSRSWVLRQGEKINKKQLEAGTLRNCKVTWEEVKELEWAHVHKHKIERLVGQLQDIEKLRTIADLVGYKEEIPHE